MARGKQAALFRELVRAGGKRRKPRMPRQAEPTAIQRMYLRMLKETVLADLFAEIRATILPVVKRAGEVASRLAQDGVTTDAYDPIGEAMDRAENRFFARWSRRQLQRLPRIIAAQSADFNKRQLKKQLDTQIPPQLRTVDIFAAEPWLLEALDEFAVENAALITSIPQKLFSEVETLTKKGVADGVRYEDLVGEVEERFGVSESRAKLIARDQVSKLNGDLNRVRQQDLGITSYVWRTVGDERVRTSHEEYNGQTFAWNDTPEEGHPGEPIQCRCQAEPVIDLTELE